jgi:hypothetical protein
MWTETDRLRRLERRRARPAGVSDTHRKERYGLPAGEFERLLDLQDRKCGICGKTHESCAKGLHLDHDHQTGAVRGLLCFTCNMHLSRRGMRKGFEVESQNWLNRIVAG